MVIIIFEGAQGTGKTTLIKNFRKECNLPFWSYRQWWKELSSQEIKATVKAINLTTFRMLELTHTSMIFDRHFFTEKVYSYRNRGYKTDIKEFIEFANKHEIIFVLVTCNPGTAWMRSNDRPGRSKLEIIELETTQRMFKVLMKKHCDRLINIDTSTITQSTALNYLQTELKMMLKKREKDELEYYKRKYL